MAKAVDCEEPNELGKTPMDAAELQWAPGHRQDRGYENLRPINVQLIIDGSRSPWVDQGNQWGFTFHRTKLFSVFLILLLALGTTYARTRYVCQSFRNEGRFYYGMDVDRCVGVLITEPLASLERHLAKLDASY